MTKFILEKSTGFNAMKARSGEMMKKVEECFSKEYKNMAEILNEMREKSGFGGFYVPKDRLITRERTLDQDFLPLIITEWPLYCNYDLHWEIGKIKVIQD